MAPNQQQVKAATDALRNEAKVWDVQAEVVGSIATKAEELSLNRVEAGLFQLIVGPYTEVVDQVKARCSEGREQMCGIADALVEVANTYEAEDAAGEHKIRNAY